MDINEAKKFIQDKIVTDKLTQKVRTVIKEKKWEKQDIKEGFKDSFKPLIKPQVKLNETIEKTNKEYNEKIEDIKEQQLALTEGLVANRLALTQGLEAIKALMPPEFYEGDSEYGDDDFMSPTGEKEDWQFPPPEDKDQKQKEPDSKEPPTKGPVINLEQNFSKNDLKFLDYKDFIRPSNFLKKNRGELKETLDNVNKEIRMNNGTIAGLKRKKNPTKEDKNLIKNAENNKLILKNYKDVLSTFINSMQYQTGSGVYFNNPNKLLDRLELLAGSILAGNNGVIPEFTQLIHYLNQINVISKKQVNNLLKNYIGIT